MSVSSSTEKEPWQIDFENEPVNDERWNCVVTSLTETKAEDEELLRIFIQSATRGIMPLIQSIEMSDLIAFLKNGTKQGDNKRKTNGKNERNVKENQKEQLSSPPHLSSRFPEVLKLISENAKFSEGQCKMPPNIMAYALKCMILEKKNKDYFQRRINNALRLKKKESEIKAQIIRKLKGLSEEEIVPEKAEDDKMWRREKFDVLEGSPCQHGPFNGPEMYIVLSNFYEPLYFAELRKINVPFTAVIKIEHFGTISGKISSGAGLKKQEWINYFWTEFERGIRDGSTTVLYKDIALLKYVPAFRSEFTPEEKSEILVNDLVATLYSTYHLNRLHQSYIDQMKVHRIIESAKPLDLSRCEMYNKLCDALVTEDANAETFILFSIIEQVVIGVPETVPRASDPEQESTGILMSDSHASKSFPSFRTDKEETLVNLDYLEARRRKKKKPVTRSKNPVIYLYDDLISLKSSEMDQNILKTEEIFKRFVINSALPKITNKYPKLIPAEKAKNDFHFFRMWEKSKETEQNFKIKLFFSIAMRLIEHTQVFEGGCEDLAPSSELLISVGSESRKTKSRSDVALPSDDTSPGASFCQEAVDLFYRERQEAANLERKKSSTKGTIQLKKVAAFPGLAVSTSTSFENLEAACGRCPMVEEEDERKSEVPDNEATGLEQLLESYEITYMNEPNLLIDRKDFEAFVAKHKFYEILEPNRSVQRLQKLYDSYNTTEYTYFSPTDTLFVLGHNEGDFRGVYHYQEKGFLISSVSLRDFLIYVLPENRKWMEDQDREYVRFLEGVREKLLSEEKRKEEEFKRNFLKKFCIMTEVEKERFLETATTVNEGNGGGTKRESSREIRTLEDTIVDDMEDLPIKAKQSQPEKFNFNGFDFGGIHTQVNVTENEFHSEDGLLVGIRTLSWLYGGRLVTLTVRRMGSKLYLHKWAEGKSRKELVHFKDSSGILVTFDLERSAPSFSTVTWPNGLTIETLPAEGGSFNYIKQIYGEKYRDGDDIATERFRCYLPNGQLLIFRVNETVDILCPNGTKYECQVQVPTRKKKFLDPSSATDNHRRLEEPEIKIKSIIMPTGEVWMWDECSKCRNLVKTMTLLTGVDPGTKETFYRREDGTNCMLWPDGKLVTSYPDGTKITSKPEFEEEEICIDGSVRNIEKEFEGGSSKPRISFADDVPDVEESDGFTVVTCSYLMEHPKYATVLFKFGEIELRMLEKMKIVLQAGTYKIESHHSVLKATSESFEFYTACRRCGKRSTSTIYLNSSDEDLLCKTKDFNAKKFVVYGSGQILHETQEEDIIAPEYEEEELVSLKSSNSVNQQPPEYCEHHRICKPFQKCLVLERDLTGMEFINEKALYRYIGSLSEDCSYDLCRLSADKTSLQHAFFDPVYATGKDRYIMKYEEDDAHPRRITRKQMDCERSTATLKVSVQNLKKKQKPKLIIARFIRVLRPDPVTIMKMVADAIAINQKRSQEVTEAYKKLSKQRKQVPFARYVAKELQLIATSLCKSLDLYPHTCTTTPYTELDIHSVGHNLNLNDYFGEVSPDDLRINILPRCKQILKPFKHRGRDKVIPELEEMRQNS